MTILMPTTVTQQVTIPADAEIEQVEGVYGYPAIAVWRAGAAAGEDPMIIIRVGDGDPQDQYETAEALRGEVRRLRDSHEDIVTRAGA